MIPLSYDIYGPTTILLFLAILMIGGVVKQIRSRSVKH